MKLSELRQRYKQGTPVDVLAELVGCSRQDILFALGDLVAEADKPSEKEQLFYDLYLQGKTDSAIFREAKRSSSLVHKWLSESGLEPNGGQKLI